MSTNHYNQNKINKQHLKLQWVIKKNADSRVEWVSQSVSSTSGLFPDGSNVNSLQSEYVDNLTTVCRDSNTKQQTKEKVSTDSIKEEYNSLMTGQH